MIFRTVDSSQSEHQDSNLGHTGYKPAALRCRAMFQGGSTPLITFKVDPTLSNVFQLSWKIIKSAAYLLSSNSTFGLGLVPTESAVRL